MRFRAKRVDATRPYFMRVYEWHEWFAWRPVRITDTEIAWLEVVERKRRSFEGMVYRPAKRT